MGRYGGEKFEWGEERKEVERKEWKGSPQREPRTAEVAERVAVILNRGIREEVDKKKGNEKTTLKNQGRAPAGTLEFVARHSG